MFCAIALPWYFAVQMRNPQFFREFILEHNLARFSSNLYHHPEPFWYYIPVAALALVPWIVVVIAAFVESTRAWWAERKSSALDRELQFRIFTSCWMILPITFFSISQSKLPGYILPAVPAGAILLADYLLQHIEREQAVSRALVIGHSLVASAPIVPAMLVGFIVTQHRLPAGRPLMLAVAVACVVCVAIVFTLASHLRLRMLRFVTLIPVVLAVAAALRFGAPAIDHKLSTRPLAIELANIETHRLPLAVYGVPREVEYGLAFYRNQSLVHYETGSIPAAEHLLVSPSTWMDNVAKATAGRRVSFLGRYASQDLNYYWVSAEGVTH